VIGIRNDSVIVKYAYINNDHGDPVFYEETSVFAKSGVYRREHYTYQYDDKGNWIRQLTRAEVDPGLIGTRPPGDPYPSYSLKAREITYSK
jgi:hypothetical protein